VALRLSHVLVLMALVLAAGVLSVQGLADGVGSGVVQGTIVVSAPGLGLGQAQALARERDDVRWTVLSAGDGSLAPFDDGLVSACVSRGVVTSLFVPPAAEPAGGSANGMRDAWRVLVTPDSGDAIGSLLDFVRAQTGTRPFLAGLILPEADAPGAPSEAELLEALCAAADSLPSFRRTTLVLLGQRQLGSGVRVAVRLDRGRTTLAAPATLVDLLERDR
jgi:hypothetical protein